MSDKFENIRAAILNYQQRLSDNMVDGQPRWKAQNVQRRIAQAAINYNGYIVTGTRHTCPIIRMQIDAIGWELLREWNNGKLGIQGFTDQYGEFLTREEAYPIAKAAGQIIREDTTPGRLYSECYI